ncbi:MAG: serine/threonine-protein kinase [Chthoniobacteraceae bacterium]
MSDTPTPSQHASKPGPPRLDAESAGRLLDIGQEPEPPPDPLPTPEEIQRNLPQYDILDRLGRGGMGVVYKARQRGLDRVVAIKLLPPKLSGDADFVARFEREARAMGKLNHPNIVTVHDSGRTVEGRLFFVMEFVDGSTLADLIGSGSLDAPQVLSITAQICDALAYAHGEGVVHRDIKPANVMVDWHGRVKVADFGLARLVGPEVDPGFTTTGTIMGTPDYMAPEQRRGMHVDQRADIFSVGVMLYEMFCGTVPRGVFTPPSAHSGCDVRIDEIVHCAMQQEPDRRFQSTQDLRAAIEVVRSTGAKLPRPPRKKSHARLVGGLSVFVVLVAVGLAVFDPDGRARKTGGGAQPGVVPNDPIAEVKRVIAKLKEFNPKFDTTTASWKVEEDRVVELKLNITAITDLSPVRALGSLKRLRLGQADQTSPLDTLDDLEGLALEWLECHNSNISGVEALREMPLGWFVCQGAKVSDLSPLASSPIYSLGINQTAVTTLDAVRGMRLKFLNCGRTDISDLSPLRGMPLTDFNCSRTRVRDLSPVKGMALTRLICDQAFIEDLEPLRGMPLKEIECDFDPARDTELLRSIRTLAKINGMPAAEFWKQAR